MKMLLLLAASIFVLVAGSSNAQIVAETFDSDLSAWPLNKSGIIVEDPFDETNSVLTFQAANAIYDLKSDSIYCDAEATYVFSFRYLGLPGPQSAQDNCGGYISIQTTPLIGYDWDTTPCEVAYEGDLVDDGQWHSYELQFQLSDLGGAPGDPIYIAIEDWNGAASACPPDATVGDVFFDDVILAPAGTVSTTDSEWGSVKALYR